MWRCQGDFFKVGNSPFLKACLLYAPDTTKAYCGSAGMLLGGLFPSFDSLEITGVYFSEDFVCVWVQFHREARRSGICPREF